MPRSGMPVGTGSSAVVPPGEYAVEMKIGDPGLLIDKNIEGKLGYLYNFKMSEYNRRQYVT
jgi:hypothetical protein